MSVLPRSGLSRPIEATILSELGCRGHFETSAFQALSLGKTCSCETTLSASGVLNSVGAFTSGGAAPREVEKRSRQVTRNERGIADLASWRLATTHQSTLAHVVWR